MKTIAIALAALTACGARVAAVSTAALAEAELTELAFRADLHAATMAALDADLDRAHASLASAADEASREAMHAAAETDARAAGALQSAATAGWRYGGTYAPQSYGQWRMARGTWSFGGDKRIECEACSYVTYFLIDRLGVREGVLPALLRLPLRTERRPRRHDRCCRRTSAGPVLTCHSQDGAGAVVPPCAVGVSFHMRLAATTG